MEVCVLFLLICPAAARAMDVYVFGMPLLCN